LIKSIIASVSDKLKQGSSPIEVEAPIFPLGSVLFPGGTMALKIFEQRYMDMAKQCLKHAAPFGIALIREGEEVGTPALSHPVGTLARIDDWEMATLGVLEVRVKGEERFRVLEQKVLPSGLIVGNLELIDADDSSASPALAACATFLKTVHSKIYADARPDSLPDESQYLDISWVSFRLTEILPFSNSVKQKMLELTDAKMRLEILQRFLRDQKLIPD
jgi:uncharacterized protein